MPGRVYIVGAGPGDIGLLTLRAKDLLEKSEVVVYDNLVNKKIISDYCPGSCEKIYVGKSGSHHTMEQDEINRLLVRKAMEDKNVVRLKGGDPFIFGRGGEEALFLADNGIEFEIVNGISSAYSVPACAGIPVTHRGMASSVAFITGHEDPEKMETDIHWDKIATGIQTLVFLMGVKNLPFIIEKLVKNGRSPSTPAAVIQNGCSPLQKTVCGTMSDIHEKAVKEGIMPPSIIVIGEVASLRDRINWFEKKPLIGKTIIVTRSREQSSDLSGRLSDFGANVIEVPSIKIMPADNDAEIKKTLCTIGTYDWIIFTSANGVSHFFASLLSSGLDARALSRAKICAIGTATSGRLFDYGIKPDLVPQKFTTDGIYSGLADIDEIRKKSFLLARADIAPEDLAERLRSEGASEVNDLTIYRTTKEKINDSDPSFSILKNGNYDLVTFTSSSTVKNFTEILSGMGIESFTGIKCATIGPVTEKTASGLGFNVVVSSEVHTIERLSVDIKKYYYGSE
ncbi:MAG: uroporphyrinogen-III C-methyltransferase [Spirochaetes bacterium]|jgi:uroporphyrinogen III methyltransferase/synthase|nr:uroporphyrinogen-III C-methyltransferase [Spirochaetota bacterium]